MTATQPSKTNSESLGVSVFLEIKQEHCESTNILMPPVQNKIWEMVNQILSVKYDMFAVK